MRSPAHSPHDTDFYTPKSALGQRSALEEGEKSAADGEAGGQSPSDTDFYTTKSAGDPDFFSPKSSGDPDSSSSSSSSLLLSRLELSDAKVYAP